MYVETICDVASLTESTQDNLYTSKSNAKEDY